MTTDGQAQRIATFKLPPEEYKELEEIAEREERSVSAVLRLAVRLYIEEAKTR